MSGERRRVEPSSPAASAAPEQRAPQLFAPPSEPETAAVSPALPALPARGPEHGPSGRMPAGLLLALGESAPSARPAEHRPEAGVLPLAELLAVREHELAPRSRPSRLALKRAVGWLRTLVLVFLLYVALFNVSVVRGSSMTPGIHDGDRIVVDRFAYMLGHVERGDVVVLKYPLDPTLDYIKRVIGLPGDEIAIEDGRVWVNGSLLQEPYVESVDPLSRVCAHVQPAHYFVLGDNRPRSSDSREFGQVPMDYVRGRVEMRLWPLSRIGTVR